MAENHNYFNNTIKKISVLKTERFIIWNIILDAIMEGKIFFINNFL